MKKYFSENEWEIIVSVLSEEADENDRKRYEELLSDPDKKEYLDEVRKIWDSSSESSGYDRFDSKSAIEKVKSYQNYLNDRPGILLRKVSVGYILKIAAVALILTGITLFWIMNGKSQRSVAYNTITVRYGEQTHVTLSDGTNIWLNSGSKLMYPSSFNGDTREVRLEGEAYFDVAHDENKLFVVNTDKVRIKVLGTAFNVKSYPGDDKIETTLVRGMVVIDKNQAGKNDAPIVLKPGEKVTFSFSHPVPVEKRPAETKEQVPAPINKVAIAKVDPFPITSWKERELVFDNSSLEDMAVTLERWFGTPVHLTDDTLKQFRYKGRFTHNETIFQVLEVIKITTPLDYVFKNHEITIRQLK